MDRRLAGRCGTYCGACTIFRSFQDGGDLLEELSDKLKVSKEEIHCSGCQGPDDQLWMYCRACKLRKCMDGKGIETCFNCKEFQNWECGKFEEVSAFAQDRGEDLRANLAQFHKEESSWLEQQNSKWRCPSCGGPTSWYERRCHHCLDQL
jgi:hypothetical protein